MPKHLIFVAFLLLHPSKDSGATKLRDGFDNDATDLKRGRGGRGRRVADVDGRRAMDNQEVIHEAAIRPQCLGAHPCLSRDEVLFTDFGNQLLQAADERPLLNDRCISSSPDFACLAARRQKPA